MKLNHSASRNLHRAWACALLAATTFCFAGLASASTQVGPNFVVNSLADTDDGSADLPGQGTGNMDCTLREAIKAANSYGGGATITFALSGTITVGSLLPNMTKDMTLDGSGQKVTVSGNDSTGIFQIYNALNTVNFNALTVAHARGNSTSGLYVRYASVNITNCTFSNNDSLISAGGAIRLNESAHAVITNSTFANNSALYGAGIYIGGVPNGAPSSVQIYNCTFSDNHSIIVDGSPRVADVYANQATAELRNTVLVTDTSNSQNVNCQGITYSDAHDIYNAGTLSGALKATATEIKLDTLKDNGGPTATIALLAGSVALGYGDDGVANAAPVKNLDQRGYSRVGASQGQSDVGAYEATSAGPLAEAPMISPSSGTFDGSAQITLTSATPNSSFYYTTDGSAPGPNNPTAHLYSGPFLLTYSATLRAVTVRAGYANSLFSSANYTILDPFVYWRSWQGLPSDGSQDLKNPSGDGISNLLKYAFNLAPNAGDLYQSNVKTLAAGGTAGLPAVSYDGAGRLVLEFVRRKASTTPGISYIVETSDDLMTWGDLDVSNASVTSIDNNWERVRAVDSTLSPRRFGRVRVSETQSAYYDYNYYPIYTALYGSATVINEQSPSGAIRLTDEVNGGIGWMILDGPAVGSSTRGFRARFQIQIGPIASGVPADGVSFAAGDLPTSGWGEGGPGNGHSIAIGFDTFNNEGSGGPNDSGIHLWVNGTHIASNPISPYTNGVLVAVEVSYDPSSGVSVIFNGNTVLSNVAVPAFNFLPSDRFGFAGRTGGYKERAVIDNVQISLR